MAFSFDENLSTAKDRMRFALGDTDAIKPLRQDEQYFAVIALYPDEMEAQATMAESLAVEFARKPDSYSESGGVSVRWSERVKTWLAIAKTLRTQAALAAAGLATSLATTREEDGTAEYVRETWFTP